MTSRVQRRMAKGWRKPAGAVDITRPGPYGNPWRIRYDRCTRQHVVAHTGTGAIAGGFDDSAAAVRTAVVMHRHDLDNDSALQQRVRAELTGKTLMCWCAVDAPCHGDNYIALTNL